MYHKQFPDYIQQCGLMIDFEHCQAHTLYADRLEDGSLPEVVECDTVATCAVMIRGDAIRTTDVGIMPEDNFIYWDDMEWDIGCTLPVTGLSPWPERQLFIRWEPM